MMSDSQEKMSRKSAKAGWMIGLIMSGIMILAGLSWVFTLPDMLLENIAEMSAVDPGEFKIGDPSASDVITMIAQGYGIGFTAVGFTSLLLALEGSKNGSRWAWKLLWMLTATFAALAFTFLQAGENASLSFGVLSFAVLSTFGQILGRKDF
jgi:hypothetical protein